MWSKHLPSLPPSPLNGHGSLPSLPPSMGIGGLPSPVDVVVVMVVVLARALRRLPRPMQ